MNRMTFRLASAIACGAALIGIRMAAASPVPPPVFSEFHATMLEANEALNPPFTGAAGFARFVLDGATNQMTYEIRMTGLVSGTAAHIHRSAGVGVSGPVVFNFIPAGQSITPLTPLTGTIKLNAAQLGDLFAGRYYVNVHTPSIPSGHIRGQVWPREATRTFATQLAGAFEVPPVSSPGSGLALVMVNDKADRIFWNFGVTGVETPTIAHIHENVFGAIGPVAFDLLGANVLTNNITITGTAPISASHFTNLLEGRYYANVHSEVNPGGDIRGQLRPLYQLREAVLSGDNEVAPVASTGNGRAVFNVNALTGSVDFGLAVTGIPSATAAHVHSGTTGNNGGVVLNLLAAANDNSSGDHVHPLSIEGSEAAILDPAHHIDGSVVVTNAVLRERMLDGSLYVNVHTVANPSGELRGQIEAPVRFLTYRANLSGLNETPIVTTTASGQAFFTLDTRTNELTFKVTTQGITATAMHIHTGSVGTAGGVAFTLAPTGTVTLNTAQVDALNTHGFYVNVHSTANPGGELRGQIDIAPVARLLTSALNGLNEAPVVSTTATGAGSIAIDATQMRFDYQLSASNIVSVTAAHIHRGAAGAGGPVVFNLPDAPTLSSGAVLSGTFDLTPTVLNELMSGGLYFNVHTSSNPAGLIRGQIEKRTRTYLPVMARF
jgi:hypothetical protein